MTPPCQKASAVVMSCKKGVEARARYATAVGWRGSGDVERKAEEVPGR